MKHIQEIEAEAKKLIEQANERAQKASRRRPRRSVKRR
jgi:hypothetical protein